MDRFAQVCFGIAQTASRLKKVHIAAGYLRILSDDDLQRAVHFLCGQPVAGEGSISVGYAKIRDAVRNVIPWDEETVRLCYRESGDAGEAIGLLVDGYTLNEPMTLATAASLYQRLFEMNKQTEKVELLADTLGRYRGPAIGCFVKILSGELRIGLQAKIVEEAVALACSTPHDAIRQALNRSGDLARVALAARLGQLDQIEASLFHPMDYMLAKPIEQRPEITDLENWVAENKYDGIRAQLHRTDERVAIFSRGMDDITESYPELFDAARRSKGSFILDGEILAWREGRAMSFSLLQQRLARKKLSEDLLNDVPVAFIAYDVLYRDGELLFSKPLNTRRALLEEILNHCVPPILLSPQQRLHTKSSVDDLFEVARARGNEGLILKQVTSIYESGKRSGSWVKVKRPFATLDVVITAAEQGHGKRASMLSDYTFAVRDDDRFLNVGKAYSGLTDDEIREMTQLLRSIATGRYGRALVVEPQIVLEVAFDSIQQSPRHKSGYALRFPRIVRWRRDKSVNDIDTLQRVAELHEASLRHTGGL